jgi:glycosyltransferase involved in cell wall biosynthesis
MLFSATMLATAQRTLADCDALLSHFALPCGIAASLVGQNRPHHAIVHGSDAVLLKKCPSVVQRFFFDGCTSIQCVHPGLRRDWPPLSVPLIDHPMGWSPHGWRREHARADLQITDNQVLVLCIARCIELKGLAVLSQAARQLSASPNVRFVVIGDGPLREKLTRQASANITFVGELSAQLRDRWLAAADIYVQPSCVIDQRTDSAPTALVEAMGAGLASVVSQVGALPWLAANSAIVVAPNDVSALARALTLLAENPSLRLNMGRLASERAQQWSWSSLAKRIEDALTTGVTV